MWNDDLVWVCAAAPPPPFPARPHVVLRSGEEGGPGALCELLLLYQETASGRFWCGDETLSELTSSYIEAAPTGFISRQCDWPE